MIEMSDNPDFEVAVPVGPPDKKMKGSKKSA